MKPWEIIVYWYDNKIENRVKIAFFSSLIAGILAHLFAFMNVLNNYDNINHIPKGVGVTLKSGRWFLMLIEKIQNKYWDTYSIPFFNGIITILILAICACMITDMFQIKDVLNCILVGAVWVCFPTVTSTLFFTYTAPQYALAVFFVILAVYYIDQKRYGILLSIVLLACSLGIYQAYLPLAAGLLVLRLIYKMICGELEWKQILFRGFKYLFSLGGGVAVYMIVLQYLLNYYQVNLNSYQGIDSMGEISLAQLTSTVVKILKNYYHLIFQDYCGMSSTVIVQRSIVILGGITVFMIFYFMYKKTVMDKVVVGVLCIAFVIAADSIEIMCPNSYIYTLMIYGMVNIYLIPVVLVENLKSKKINIVCSWVVTLTLSLVCLNYIWSSNVNYTALHYIDVETQEYLSSMATRMKSAEGYTDDTKVFFVGENINDNTYKDVWGEVPVLYGGNASTLINHFSRNKFFKYVVGYHFEKASKEQQNILKELPEVKNMPCYPDDGSVKMIEGVLVVKLEN